MDDLNSIGLPAWINKLQSMGKIAFPLNQARMAFPALSEDAIKLALNRLSKKGRVVSIHKGYYLIIDLKYASKGMLPPALYIDGLMEFLQRPYYVGLLSAAAYHGAAHQQPQEFFVITSLPALRATQRKGLKVNYISKKLINEELIESLKTESGYLKISSPLLTATDLIQFEKRIGGMNRATAVINELAEVLKPEMFTPSFFNEVSTHSIQRLGYLLEYKLSQKELADALLTKAREAKLSFFRVPLKSDLPVKGLFSDEKWKVIANTEIEIDE